MTTPVREQLLALISRPKYKVKPAHVVAIRERAHLTQAECAGLMKTSLRGWQAWELGERAMAQYKFELFAILVESADARAALRDLKPGRV